MTTLIFDKASADDHAYLLALCDATMRRCVEADLGDCFDRIAPATITRLLERGSFYKLVLNGAVVGAMACEHTPTHIQLEELYVEPSKQRDGIGTSVMQALLGEARTKGLPIRLHVLASNSAKAFYEKLGFDVTRATDTVTYMEMPA